MAPSPSLANQQFAWSAWVRPDGAGATNDRFGNAILEQDIDTTTLSLGLYWRATDSHFLFAFGNDFTEFIVSQNAFPAGQFYLVTGTYDGSTFQLYVNGNLEAQRVQTKTMVYSATNTWTIGAESANIRAIGVPRTWNGVIDEVQAFNRALTLAEIQSIYAAGSLG